MHATCYKALLAVISFLVVALVYSSFSAFHVFAVPPAAGFLSPDAECDYDHRTPTSITCCWTESATEPFGIKFCQTCEGDGDCGKVYPVYPELKQPPTTPPGPGAPLGSIPEGGGILPELEQTPPSPPQSGDAPEVAPPTIAPEDSQGDDQSGTDGSTGGGGGVKPPVKDLLPDTGITEQPEIQQPEEEPSNEGEGPAGPLT